MMSVTLGAHNWAVAIYTWDIQSQAYHTFGNWIQRQ
jgi:hypothetical protein